VAGHGGVTLGSETAGGIRNVLAERCSFDSPDLDMAMRFKTNPARGGFVEDVYIRDCTVKTAKYGIHMTLRYGSGGRRDGDSPPVLRNIDIRNSTFGTLTKGPIFIEGYSPENKITDVTIANCTFEPMKKGMTITNATRVVLMNVKGVTGN
jgi:polygalacturonase